MSFRSLFKSFHLLVVSYHQDPVVRNDKFPYLHVDHLISLQVFEMSDLWRDAVIQKWDGDVVFSDELFQHLGGSCFVYLKI
jgi:hypothetical protein